MLPTDTPVEAGAHTFHIPVMGTGFTIDTPLRVARYGISSVISVVDDELIEKIRRYYCGIYGEPYEPIKSSEREHRSARITAYLNLVDRMVKRQVSELKKGAFDGKSELSTYFEMLSDASDLKQAYLRMLDTRDGAEKLSLQSSLRQRVTAGSIDINIMTKADRENTFNGQKLSRQESDALSALRGFAESTLHSSVVFSAGLNSYLYSFTAEFEDFYEDASGESKKHIILKVSDFRSAFIQAKMLAKKGIWTSEFRIESGLNCGGHAFPSAGHLLGPILEEFKTKKQQLIGDLYPIYRAALLEKGRICAAVPRSVRVTAQGGVGTANEHKFLQRYYKVDSVGWGSPFLLVPEATAVDNDTLNKLVAADENDIFLSNASPLGVPFYNLHSSASEQSRLKKIEDGKPGSPCINKYLAFNTEYGESLCVSSARYQQMKLRELEGQGLSEEELAKQREKVLEKACICRHLGDGALLKYGIPDEIKVLTPAVCPGPNLVYFSRVYSLKEMIQHIYGTKDILDHSIPRPHFFINELKLNIRYLKELIADVCGKAAKKDTEYFHEFKMNLTEGVDYYKGFVHQLQEESESARQKFMTDLLVLKSQLEGLVLPVVAPSP